MDEMNDSVSSNPEQFVNDDEIWLNMIAADSNENQGDHDPPPFWNLEAPEGTSTSILDREWGWLNEIPQPAGHNNYNSSDCWSAASDNNFLPAAASDAVTPPLLNVATDGAENVDAAVIKSHVQELEELLEMDNSVQQLPSCGTHIVSLESDEEDWMSFESHGDEIQSQSTVNLREEISEVNSQNPELGMVFSSEEEAYMFYTTYAKGIGFSVRKAKVRRLSNGTIRKRFFFCSRQGFRVKKQSTKATKYQRKETRTGCDAMVEFTVENGKWVISGFTPEHNHDVEGKSKLMVGSSTKILEDHSISTAMNKAAVLKEAQPTNSVGFQGINCSGFPHDEKTSCPKLLDGQSLIEYFRCLQMEAPSFSHAVQVNAENCLTGFFWMDGRSRIDYDYFGDVVILDTTFRIDPYNMIYAPFLGLNHHGQYVLFGGTLLLDDSKDSLIWLLRTFLDSMGRRQPKTIFTDGYQAMADAVEVVLPKTHHLLGIWYILRNAKANLSKCYGKPGFNNLFMKCIFDCETEEEFESMWESLLEQYELHANPWLKTQYMLRRKWSHCFCKSIFSAGIRSSQHCHGINRVFHSLTSKATTPLQFVQQYFKVAEQQRREELYEDFRCNGSAPATILRNNAIEKEAAKIYSCMMFKLFQEELLECLSVGVEEIQGDGMTAKFRLTEEGHKEKIVEFNCVEPHLTCSCKKYESVGILCVHALKVLNAKNIFHIPPQYILKRWTKSAKDGMVVDGHVGEVVDDSQRHLHLDKSKLMHKALNVITKSLAFEETRMIAEDYLNIALKNVEDALRTKNIGHLNTRDVDVAYKDAAAAADANGIICVETQQMESNPSTVNQQEASNYRTKCQLKRKYDNYGRVTKSKSSDGAIIHRPCFKEVTKGGDCQGSKKGASWSYSMGGNSRQSACVSALPPLPSQSTCNQFKDHNKFKLNVQQNATQIRLQQEKQRMSKLSTSMHADNSHTDHQYIWKNMLIQQKSLALQEQLEAIRGDNSVVLVTVESRPGQISDVENLNGGLRPN